MIAELAKRRRQDNPDTFCLTDAEAMKLAGEMQGLVLDQFKHLSSTREIYQAMKGGTCQIFGIPVKVWD